MKSNSSSASFSPRVFMHKCNGIPQVPCRARKLNHIFATNMEGAGREWGGGEGEREGKGRNDGERERERERKTDRQTDRGRKRERERGKGRNDGETERERERGGGGGGGVGICLIESLVDIKRESTLSISLCNRSYDILLC